MMEHISPGLVVRAIGNTYSGSSLLGLAATLDIAEPDERILLVSFGSGAGSDAFALRVTERISTFEREQKVWDKIERKMYVDYAIYLKHRRKIKA